MARIRTIKPDYWTDEKIVELDPLHRLLFIGMWNFADDQGYLDFSPKRIKMQVFPGDDVDVSRGLASLLELGLIRLYDSPAGLVLHIVNWDRHQRISNPSRGRFAGSDLQECPPEQNPLASPLEDSVRKGREGKGREVLYRPSADADEAESDRFDEFWAAYPRKTAKRNAEKAWKAATKRTDPQQILDGLARFKFSDDPQFVAHPATWLNGDRWEDQAQLSITTPPPGGTWTEEQLTAVLGPDRWRAPQPPSEIPVDEQWDWVRQQLLAHRVDRVRQAIAKQQGGVA